MSKYRYIFNGGLMFQEDKIIEKLREYSIDGWVLDKVGVFSYRLKRGETQEKIFKIENDSNYEDESYIKEYEEAGWAVAARGLGYTFLSTAPDNKDFYWDKKVYQRKHSYMEKATGRGFLIALIIGIVLLIMEHFVIGYIDIGNTGFSRLLLNIFRIIKGIDIFALVLNALANIRFKIKRILN